MTTLRKLLFFFLILVILGAGACSQTEEIEQKQFTSEKLLQISKLEQPTIEELIQSAEQGDVEAQYELGKLYDTGKGVPTGEGVPTDHLEAAKWYRKAAEQGYANAQFRLGDAYRKGLGVPQDYQEAFKWFQMAAGQGDAAAQFKLAAMYHKGEGVPKDYVLAYMWWDLSLSQKTDDDARKKEFEWLNLLEKKMTTEQIAEAQRLAHEFKPKGEKE